MTITALRHKDVRGKELLYLIVKNKVGTEVIVNVGEKTFNGVENLVKEEEGQLELPIGEKLQNAEEKLKKEVGNGRK